MAEESLLTHHSRPVVLQSQSPQLDGVIRGPGDQVAAPQLQAPHRTAVTDHLLHRPRGVRLPTPDLEQEKFG